jgi:hypothetical protein
VEKDSEHDIRRRALAAWHRQPKSMDAPTPGGCELVTLEGRGYAVLHAGSQVVAVYRVRPSGQLKYLVRPPRVFGAGT